jgi:hypothetical protein
MEKQLEAVACNVCIVMCASYVNNCFYRNMINPCTKMYVYVQPV